MGRGSLDFAKQLVAENLPEEQPPPSDLPWCKCGVCSPMETEQENVCCNKRQCITSFRTFYNICLDRDILEVCIKARCDIRADEFNFSMESFRKAAYRQFALWTYGKLGRGNRRVLPACAVRMIRRAYPSPDGRYMGFRNNWTMKHLSIYPNCITVTYPSSLKAVTCHWTTFHASSNGS